MTERPSKRRGIEERSKPGVRERHPGRPRSQKEIDELKARAGRRAFLTQIVPAAVIAGGTTFGGFKLYEFFKGAGATDEEAGELALSIHERDTDGRTEERFLQMSESPLFFDQLKTFIRHYRDHGDLALALSPENGRARTVNDPEGRSRIDFVREEVMKGLSDSDIPEDIQDELSFYAVGMFATESKYQRDLESGAGAVGLGQAIPDTYALYGKDEEEMRYLSHQVDLMRAMFKDYYAVMMHDAGPALQKIRTNYFPNLMDFNRQFFSLCLVNAYQVGLGNMMNVIKKFSELPVRTSLKSYDVFEAMALIAKDGALDGDYRDESYNYAKQSSAFAFLLAASDTSAV